VSAQLVQRLPGPIAGFLGLAVLAAIILFRTVLQHVGVMAHEGAHVFANSCMGGTADYVKLNSDGTGETGYAEGGGIFAGFAGYLGPSACGLVAAAMIEHDQIVPVLWAGVVLLLILLCSVRGFFGGASVISLGLFLFVVARYAPSILQAVTAYSLTWLLLMSGLRVLFEHGTGAFDAAKLRARTSVPRILWAGLWLIGRSWPSRSAAPCWSDRPGAGRARRWGRSAPAACRRDPQTRARRCRTTAAW